MTKPKILVTSAARRTGSTAVPANFDRWERDRGHPILKDIVLAQDSPEWRASAEKQELYLLKGQPS